MAEINISRQHKLGLKKAKTAAQKLADQLAQSLSVVSHWEGNVLHFSRAGVDGELTVTKDHVSLSARLGMLVSAFKSTIEAQVARDFDKYFA